MTVNQKEIAKKAGVSRATVSRAFTQNANISPETLIKIQNAMCELGIEPISKQPDRFHSRSNYVLIVVGDVSDGFYSRVVKGICDRVSILGLLPVICNSSFDSAIEENSIRHAGQEKYAGIIMITAVETADMVEALQAISIPVILVNRYIRSLDMDVVCIDNYRGGYMATNYLIEHGHRKIVHLAGSRVSTAPQDRLQGYTDALRDAHIELPKKYVFFGDQSISSGREFASELISRKTDFTAVFIANCLMSVGAVKRFTELGYRIPEDISVICFDDSPLIDDNGLSLTTVSYDPYKMGCDAVDTLIRRIQGPFAGKAKLFFAPHLIIRSSVRDISENSSK